MIGVLNKEDRTTEEKRLDTNDEEDDDFAEAEGAAAVDNTLDLNPRGKA